jgi:putative NADH-flavin reductase
VGTGAGHSLTVLVRSPERALALSGVHLVTGDARDGAALLKALEGCGGVISALGTGVSPFKEVTLLSTAAKALIAVMQVSGTKRHVCITGMGAGDSARDHRLLELNIARAREPESGSRHGLHLHLCTAGAQTDGTCTRSTASTSWPTQPSPL